MNLHSDIMNIKVDRQKEAQATMSQDEADLAYRKGHRDARHAAAELSLNAEARIGDLELVLKQARGMVNGATDEWHDKVSKLLENK